MIASARERCPSAPEMFFIEDDEMESGLRALAALSLTPTEPK
jgi:hypothetical protein